MGKNRIAYKKAYQFVIRIVNAYKYLVDKKENSLSANNRASIYLISILFPKKIFDITI